MRQFQTILRFELQNLLKNKVFIAVTAFLVVLIAAVMFFPRLVSLDETVQPDEREIMLVQVHQADGEAVLQAFTQAFTQYTVRLTDDPLDQIKLQITREDAACAIVLQDLDHYTYYVNNLSLYDQNTEIADAALGTLSRMQAMVRSGIAPAQAGDILARQVQHETESLGKDQMQNFFYTYIMIFALYMVILMYGQMVATNVASEKSSRAMEVLITSAKPTSMMFGKVIASCMAGLIQIVFIFGSALLFFRWNASYWAENEIVQSIFNIPPSLLGYMLLFFVLGFFIYAFLYGAVGSTASKLEDINTSVMPITVLFIIAFFVVIFSMSSGNVDNLLLKVCSFIPFTSPMSMFTRIAMSTVPWYEIVISVAILLASVFGVGVLSAKIYRVGVLLYGTPPKLPAILKMLRKA